jgi:hypothetical protein
MPLKNIVDPYLHKHRSFIHKQIHFIDFLGIEVEKRAQGAHEDAELLTQL